MVLMINNGQILPPLYCYAIMLSFFCGTPCIQAQCMYSIAFCIQKPSVLDLLTCLIIIIMQ